MAFAREQFFFPDLVAEEVKGFFLFFFLRRSRILFSFFASCAVVPVLHCLLSLVNEIVKCQVGGLFCQWT